MEHVLLHAKMDIIAYFGGSTGIKYVHLPSISPLGNREKTLKKNPKLRGYIHTYKNSKNNNTQGRAKSIFGVTIRKSGGF